MKFVPSLKSKDDIIITKAEVRNKITMALAAANHSEKAETQVVWACHKAIRTCSNNPAWGSTRKENERKTAKEMGG